MTHSLWVLLGLQTRGWFRLMGRKLTTLKGALFALLGLAVFVPWILSLTLAPEEARAANPDSLRRYAPAVVLAYCLVMLLFSGGERSIYFTPAEVNFLFPGPFSRRQLLVYKIVVGVLIGLPTSLFLAVLMQVHAQWFLAAFLGLFLATQFLQLFTMSLNLVAVTVGAQAFTRVRKLALVLIVAAGAIFLIQVTRGETFSEVLQEAEQSAVWQAIATPLRWFVELFLTPAGDWLGLLRYLGQSAAVLLVLTALLLLLDTHYLETASTISEKIYSHMQRMRRGEATSLNWRSASGRARFSLPSLPWWGGTGPVAWRQLTTAFRSLGRLAFIALLVAPAIVGPILVEGPRRDEEAILVVLAGTMLWLTVLLTNVVAFDFRSDLDRMEVLKTLPLTPWRLVIGQLTVPVALVTLVQFLLLGTLQVAMGEAQPILLIGMAFAPSFNFLVFTVDNLLFLWFPTRAANSPGDFQALGRNVLLTLVKVIVLGIAGVLAATFGYLLYALTGSLFAGIAIAWLTLFAFAAAMVPVLALAFDRFDVSRDMPA